MTLSRNACYILKKNTILVILCTFTESQNALKILDTFDVTTNACIYVSTAVKANKSAYRVFIPQGPSLISVDRIVCIIKIFCPWMPHVVASFCLSHVVKIDRLLIPALLGLLLNDFLSKMIGAYLIELQL